MKNFKQWLNAGLCISLVGFGTISCSSSDDNDDDNFVQYDFSKVANTYVNKTVVATYASMKTNAEKLKDAVIAYQTNPSQENINKACQEWIATRSDWEQSEAYIFGVTEEFDKALDSWPLDKTQLDAIMADTKPIADIQLTSATGGFHTLEYLLFRDGQPRSTASFTNVREREYLVKVTTKLYNDTDGLHASWSGDRVTKFLAKPTAAIEQVIDGIDGIAGEVGPGKIGDPYKSKNVLEVESWYSWNSLTDFKDNIRSIENAYLGGFDSNNRGDNLSTYIKGKDADLDAEVRKTIQDAITAINKIPEPFRNQLDNPDSADEIEAAIEACNKISAVFVGKVKPLVVY